MAKYEVIQKHTLGHKVGDVIELTENQAKCLVNKVKLVPEREKPAKKTKKADK